MRLRSSATASWACSTLSRSARSRRSCATSASWRMRPRPNPTDQAIVKTMVLKTKLPTPPFGSLWAMIAVTPVPKARPAIACVRSRRRPNRANTVSATRNVIRLLGNSWSSTNDAAANTTPEVTGAPNGKRRRAKSGSVMPSTARMSNQSGPAGPSLSPCLTHDLGQTGAERRRGSAASNQYVRASAQIRVLVTV